MCRGGAEPGRWPVEELRWRGSERGGVREMEGWLECLGLGEDDGSPLGVYGGGASRTEVRGEENGLDEWKLLRVGLADPGGVG